MIRIVEAPGIDGEGIDAMRTNSRGDRCLGRLGAKQKSSRTYFYVVEERTKSYPFGAYTSAHYNTFASRDDAEEYASWFREEVKS